MPLALTPLEMALELPHLPAQHKKTASLGRFFYASLQSQMAVDQPC